MDRIQLILQGTGCEDCLGAMESAKEAAARPERISFGLALLNEPDKAGLAELKKIGQVRYLCPETDKWRSMPQLWQGEGYVLMGHQAMHFDRHWDRKLLHLLKQLQKGRREPVLLTGCLPRTIELIDAVSPVAAEGFDDEGQLCLTRGTPLRYATTPIRSAFIHPDFCFGKAEAFQRLTGNLEPRDLTAFCERMDAFTLHKPVIRLEWDDPLPPMPLMEEMDGADRFAAHFGIDLKNGAISPLAMDGIFYADANFPSHVPLAVRIQEWLRRQGNRRSRIDPLCVTAWLTMPENPDIDRTMVRLRRLGAIRDLTLLCYVDNETVRRVARSHPNVMEYKGRYGLPMTSRMRPQDLPRYARLSRPFLLAQSREKFLTHSHYIWMDMDYLSYPVYEGAALDWETICTERIVLAQVNGKPDMSMIVVPEGRLLTLCHEITALCENWVLRTGCLPDDREMWKLLMKEHPDWFRLIDLPGERELFGLTMTSRAEEWLAKP